VSYRELSLPSHVVKCWTARIAVYTPHPISEQLLPSLSAAGCTPSYSQNVLASEPKTSRHVVVLHALNTLISPLYMLSLQPHLSLHSSHTKRELACLCLCLSSDTRFLHVGFCCRAINQVCARNASKCPAGGGALPCRRANAISPHFELVDRQQQLTQSLPRPLSSFIVPLRFTIMHPSIAISLRRFVLSFLYPSGLASLRRLEHI
jgi:hypothetical protein